MHTSYSVGCGSVAEIGVVAHVAKISILLLGSSSPAEKQIVIVLPVAWGLQMHSVQSARANLADKHTFKYILISLLADAREAITGFTRTLLSRELVRPLIHLTFFFLKILSANIQLLLGSSPSCFRVILNNDMVE